MAKKKISLAFILSFPLLFYDKFNGIQLRKNTHKRDARCRLNFRKMIKGKIVRNDERNPSLAKLVDFMTISLSDSHCIQLSSSSLEYSVPILTASSRSTHRSLFLPFAVNFCLAYMSLLMKDNRLMLSSNLFGDRPAGHVFSSRSPVPNTIHATSILLSSNATNPLPL